MSAKSDANAEGAGCLFFFAAIIISLAVGSLSQAEYGWLMFGGVLLVWALASVNGRTR